MKSIEPVGGIWSRGPEKKHKSSKFSWIRAVVRMVSVILSDPSNRAESVLKGGRSSYHEPMGTFYVGCRVENHIDRNKFARFSNLLVDTGSEYTWVSTERLEKIGVPREKKDLRFQMANGEIITRSVGFAVLRVGKRFTIDEMVFAEKGDRSLLGARTLEGLNLRVDPARKN